MSSQTSLNHPFLSGCVCLASVEAFEKCFEVLIANFGALEGIFSEAEQQSGTKMQKKTAENGENAQ